MKTAQPISRTGILGAILAGMMLWSGAIGAQEAPVSESPRPKPRLTEAPPTEEAATAPAEAPAMTAAPGKGPVTSLPLPRYVSLKGKTGNARRGPSTSHRIDWVFTAPGMPLRITAEYEHWRRVEDREGLGGWVHYSLLSGSRTVLVTSDMVEALSRPDPSAEPVFQAEANVILRLLECQPDWCRVAAEGEKGWLKKSDLWGVDPGEIVD